MIEIDKQRTHGAVHCIYRQVEVYLGLSEMCRACIFGSHAVNSWQYLTCTSLCPGALPVLVKALGLSRSHSYLARTLLVVLVQEDAPRRAVLARMQGPLHLSQVLDASAGLHGESDWAGEPHRFTDTMLTVSVLTAMHKEPSAHIVCND